MDREYRVAIVSMSPHQQTMEKAGRAMAEFLSACADDDGRTHITSIPVGDATMAVIECLGAKKRPAVENPS